MELAKFGSVCEFEYFHNLCNINRTQRYYEPHSRALDYTHTK